MNVSARLQFTQGGSSPGAGISMIGQAGVAVTVSSAQTQGVKRTIFRVLDVPLNSPLAVGVLSDGAATSCVFTPNSPATPGCYRISLTVVGVDGSADTQIRNFAVPTPQGWILPPFLATAAELNFPTKGEGWEWLVNEAILSIAGGGVARGTIALVAGEHQTNLSVFTRLGATVFNPDPFAAGTPIPLKVAAQADSGQTYEIRLYDETAGAFVAGTITDNNSALQIKTLALTKESFGAGARTYEILGRLTTGANGADFLKVPTAFLDA